MAWRRQKAGSAKPEWRNWYTHQTQNLARFTPHESSSLSSGTKFCINTRVVKAASQMGWWQALAAAARRADLARARASPIRGAVLRRFGDGARSESATRRPERCQPSPNQFLSAGAARIGIEPRRAL